MGFCRHTCLLESGDMVLTAGYRLDWCITLTAARGVQGVSSANGNAQPKNGWHSLHKCRRGGRYDNVRKVSFGNDLKSELIHRRQCDTHVQERAIAFNSVEAFHNRNWSHSTLSIKTPLTSKRTPPKPCLIRLPNPLHQVEAGRLKGNVWLIV